MLWKRVSYVMAAKSKIIYSTNLKKVKQTPK
jgi:hypothetical protein